MDSILSFLNAKLLNTSPLQRKTIVASVDVVLCSMAAWLAFSLHAEQFASVNVTVISVWVLSSTLAGLIFFSLGIYNEIVRSAGVRSFLRLILGLVIYGVVFTISLFAVGQPTFPFSIGIVQSLILMFFMLVSRSLAYLYLTSTEDKHKAVLSHETAIIYGAGAAGRQLLLALSRSRVVNIVGFCDDDKALHGRSIDGIKIFDPIEIKKLVSVLKVNSILLAMPSVPREQQTSIIHNITGLPVAVRSLPSLEDLARDQVYANDLKELDLADLLGRSQVKPKAHLLESKIKSRVVAVTGAGGTIGGEISKQIMLLEPKSLLLIERSEFALYRIYEELKDIHPDLVYKVVPLLASVTDHDRMENILSTWKPDNVYHAAAHKHVPIVEQNVLEGIKNNIFGTLTLVNRCIDHGVADFVLVSSDKAVRPTNVMGATKRLSELIVQSLADLEPETRFSIVRFGNVLGSSGSVVPKFKKQIEAGGPITLTHKDMTRYFMTVEEAAQLVMQAGALANNGDLFVLDMGKPVKILDLAHRLIHLTGKKVKDQQNPNGEIEIVFSGLRPAEKLFEELLIGQHCESTSHQKILRAREEFFDWVELDKRLKGLRKSLEKQDVVSARNILSDTVSGYTTQTEICDLVFTGKGK